MKQAGELFQKILHTTKVDFKQSAHDQCIYVKKDIDSGLTTIIIIYVDDIIILGNDPNTIKSTKEYFKKSFTKIATEDSLDRYIGVVVDIRKDNEGNFNLSQQLEKVIYRLFKI